MDYDLTIIGAGWAGFNAAVKAKRSGLRVVLIDKREPGGTCLNRGCIPTKALIQSAKIYANCKKSSLFGIDTATPVQINFSKVQERKNKIVQQLRTNLQSLIKDIDFFQSSAEILSNNEIRIDSGIVKTKTIIIATGARPLELKELPFNGNKVISSDEILDLSSIPRTLLIVGGGVIGCEFASLFAALESKVTLIELAPALLPGLDADLGKKAENVFKKRGVKVSCATDAGSLDLTPYDLVLVCIGRTPNTDSLGLQKAGILSAKGRILTNEYLKTNIDNIYAAGDCASSIMLAHYAAYQGELASYNIVNPNSQIKADNQIVPSCIFTDPEIASVGLSEEKAIQEGLNINLGRFDFMGSGMARILDESDGFIKVISESKTGRILGASIIGPRATELIAILTLAISSRLSVSQIKKTIFAHPSVSESIKDAFI